MKLHFLFALVIAMLFFATTINAQDYFDYEEAGVACTSIKTKEICQSSPGCVWAKKPGTTVYSCHVVDVQFIAGEYNGEPATNFNHYIVTEGDAVYFIVGENGERVQVDGEELYALIQTAPNVAELQYTLKQRNNERTWLYYLFFALAGVFALVLTVSVITLVFRYMKKRNAEKAQNDELASQPLLSPEFTPIV